MQPVGLLTLHCYDDNSSIRVSRMARTFVISLPVKRQPTQNYCLRLCSLLQEALELEPVDKAVDPVVGGDVVLVHAEAVAAFGVHVEFGGFAGVDPFLVEGDAVGCEAEVVVGGGGDEEGRRVDGDGAGLEQ